ncbi:MAG: hypothetical protein R3C24_00395 [Cyanobacteriota/Melainabacteria group bacterium]
MVPAAPELLRGRPPIETKADDNAGDGNDKLVDPAASAEGAKDGAVTGDPQKDVPVVGNDGQDGDKPVIDPTKVKPITADMSGKVTGKAMIARPALPAALRPGPR